MINFRDYFIIKLFRVRFTYFFTHEVSIPEGPVNRASFPLVKNSMSPPFDVYLAPLADLADLKLYTLPEPSTTLAVLVVGYETFIVSAPQV